MRTPEKSFYFTPDDKAAGSSEAPDSRQASDSKSSNVNPDNDEDQMPDDDTGGSKPPSPNNKPDSGGSSGGFTEIRREAQTENTRPDPHQMFIEEGIPEYDIPKGIFKGDQAMQIAEKILGFIPHPDDYRWQLVFHYLHTIEMNKSATNKNKFSPQNLENAHFAVYLSSFESRRNRYARVDTDQNARQLLRALTNVGAIETIMKAFSESEVNFTQKLAGMKLSDGFAVGITRTDRHIDDKGPQDTKITPCPEALYQVQAFDNEHGYVGRVGFNIHTENGRIIISVTNIQGAEGIGANYYNKFRRDNHNNPFHNLLLQRVKEMACAFGQEFEIRGLGNPSPKKIREDGKKLGKLAHFYQQIFIKEDISIYQRQWTSGNSEQDNSQEETQHAENTTDGSPPSPTTANPTDDAGKGDTHANDRTPLQERARHEPDPPKSFWGKVAGIFSGRGPKNSTEPTEGPPNTDQSEPEERSSTEDKPPTASEVIMRVPIGNKRKGVFGAKEEVTVGDVVEESYDAALQQEAKRNGIKIPPNLHGDAAREYFERELQKKLEKERQAAQEATEAALAKADSQSKKALEEARSNSLLRRVVGGGATLEKVQQASEETKGKLGQDSKNLKQMSTEPTIPGLQEMRKQFWNIIQYMSDDPAWQDQLRHLQLFGPLADAYNKYVHSHGSQADQQELLETLTQIMAEQGITRLLQTPDGRSQIRDEIRQRVDRPVRTASEPIVQAKIHVSEAERSMQNGPLSTTGRRARYRAGRATEAAATGAFVGGVVAAQAVVEATKAMATAAVDAGSVLDDMEESYAPVADAIEQESENGLQHQDNNDEPEPEETPEEKADRMANGRFGRDLAHWVDKDEYHDAAAQAVADSGGDPQKAEQLFKEYMNKKVSQAWRQKHVTDAGGGVNVKDLIVNEEISDGQARAAAAERRRRAQQAREAAEENKAHGTYNSDDQEQAYSGGGAGGAQPEDQGPSYSDSDASASNGEPEVEPEPDEPTPPRKNRDNRIQWYNYSEEENYGIPPDADTSPPATANPDPVDSRREHVLASFKRIQEENNEAAAAQAEYEENTQQTGEIGNIAGIKMAFFPPEERRGGSHRGWAVTEVDNGNGTVTITTTGPDGTKTEVKNQ